MTSPESSATRPLRVAGLVLLGVAAIALVIGMISVFGGNGDDQADGGGDQPPASTSSDEPGSTTSRPSSETSKPPSSSGAPTTTTTTRPPASSPPTAPPGGDGNGEPGKTQQVRVYNNSTVGGLANRAADELREAGWTVVEVGNYPSGVIPTTTVYFRPGTAEESAAELLGDEFGMRVEPRFSGLNYGPGLIVIVTGDYQGPGGDREETEKNDK